MKKKLMAVALCLAMSLTAVGASLAYFTDTDAAENTFTSGKVDIKLVEQQLNPYYDSKDPTSGELYEKFEQGKELIPFTGEALPEFTDQWTAFHALEKNFVSKVVSVKNMKSSSDAFVRVIIGVPAEVDGTALHMVYMGQNPDQPNYDVVPGDKNVDINGTAYNLYIITYGEYVMPGATVDQPCLMGMYLDAKVDYKEGVGYTYDGVKLNLDLSNVKIPVFAQGLQADGFNKEAETIENAKAAFAQSGLPTNPWAK